MKKGSKDACKGGWCICENRCMCEQFKSKKVQVLPVEVKPKAFNDTQTQIQTAVDWQDENVLENFLNQWRRVEHDDLCHLNNLVTKTTEEIFGPIDLPNMIEHSYLFLCIVNFRKEILGAICINDYPQFSSISRTEWEEWFYTKFRLRKFNSSNSLFIHLILYHEKYINIIFGSLFTSAFFLHPRTKKLILMTQPNVNLDQNWAIYFETMPLIHALDNTPMPSYIHWVPRKSCIAMHRFRQAREEDNDRIVETIEEEEPELVKFYGKKMALDIICYDPDRIMYVAKEGAGHLAVACVNTNVNTDIIQKMFLTSAYNGFQKMTNADTHWARKSGTRLSLKSLSIHTFRAESPSSSSESSEEPEVNTKVSETHDAGVIEGIVWSTLLMHDADLEEEESEGSERQVLFEDYTMTELTCYRNLCMAVPSSVILNTLENIAPPPKIDHYFGSVNAFVIDFLMTGNMSTAESINLLNDIFKDLGKYEYGLVSIERGQQKPEFAYEMLKVQPRKNLVFDENLYFYHHWFYTGRYSVKEAEVADYPDLISITTPMMHNSIYQKELSRALYVNNRDKLKAFVLRVFGIIIGFAIVCPEKNPEYLKFQYDIDHYMKFKLHSIQNHGYIKHFMISKLFQTKTRIFLRGIMHITGFTSLYHTIYPPHIREKLEDYTPISGLKYWMPISPRLIPIFNPKLRENQPSFLMANDYPPFALYYVNYRLCSLNRRFYDPHIVVVGASETGLSFIENLIFKQSTPYVAVSNITLVTMHQFPKKYKHQHVIEIMLPKNGVYNLKYTCKLGLENVIRIIDGAMTGLDREKKQLVIDNTRFLMYDYLFLFCGTQFGNPELEQFQDFERRCTVPYDMKMTLKSIYREHPDNLFTLNAPCDASSSLEYITNLQPSPDGKIIIYGNYIGAYSCIEGLMSFGIPGNRIVYVETKFKYPFAIDQFNDPTVYSEIHIIMKALKIDVYKNYIFSSWDLHKESGKIEKIYFESQNNICSFECLAMFNFSKKEVCIKTVIALIKAHLVYDGKLVIDENFNTNDPYIFAAGPMTKYSRKFYADHLSHELFNSSEIGAELASRVPEIIKMPGYARLSPSGLIMFLKPKITHCMLPGKRYCLLVRKPGVIMPLQTMLSTQKNFSKILLTGQIPNPHQIGYFRIIIDKVDCVTDMVCVSPIPIDARNLVNIYGRHELLLNNIVSRYYSQLIHDFYEFFKEPWAFVLYHDRFPQVIENITKQYLKKLPKGKWSYLELVSFGHKLNKWKKLPEKSGLLLEDVFNHLPSLRHKIKDIFLQFVDDNANHLPMYVTDSYLQALYTSAGTDIIFDFQNVLQGIKTFIKPRVEVNKPCFVEYPLKYYEEV